MSQLNDAIVLAVIHKIRQIEAYRGSHLVSGVSGDAGQIERTLDLPVRDFRQQTFLHQHLHLVANRKQKLINIKMGVCVAKMSRTMQPYRHPQPHNIAYLDH